MSNPNFCAYEISTGLMGAPALQVFVIYDNINSAVIGLGDLTQPINPPLNQRLMLQGSFFYTLLQGAPDLCIVGLKGVPLVKWPKLAGIGPALPTVLDLNMNLNNARTAGTANFAYQNPQGEWVEVTNATVKSISLAPFALV